jgi:hypothetical protein
MRYLCAVAIAVASMTSVTPAWAGSTSSHSTLSQAGYGAGSVLGTLVYAPFKATFCILGGLASAPTYVVSQRTAGEMATASCGGTWVITPDVLRGDENVHFVGESAPARAATTR